MASIFQVSPKSFQVFDVFKMSVTSRLENLFETLLIKNVETKSAIKWLSNAKINPNK